jgi:hypothetical protein
MYFTSGETIRVPQQGLIWNNSHYWGNSYFRLKGDNLGDDGDAAYYYKRHTWNYGSAAPTTWTLAGKGYDGSRAVDLSNNPRVINNSDYFVKNTSTNTAPKIGIEVKLPEGPADGPASGSYVVKGGLKDTSDYVIFNPYDINNGANNNNKHWYPRGLVNESVCYNYNEVYNSVIWHKVGSNNPYNPVFRFDRPGNINSNNFPNPGSPVDYEGKHASFYITQINQTGYGTGNYWYHNMSKIREFPYKVTKNGAPAQSEVMVTLIDPTQNNNRLYPYSAKGYAEDVRKSTQALLKQPRYAIEIAYSTPQSDAERILTIYLDYYVYADQYQMAGLNSIHEPVRGAQDNWSDVDTFRLSEFLPEEYFDTSRIAHRNADLIQDVDGKIWAAKTSKAD